MPNRLPRLAACAAAVAFLATAAAGCGLGAGDPPGKTSLLVTQDFGSKPLVQSSDPEIAGSDTVMRLLQRNAKDVTTRYGGGFVQSIAGVAGGQSGGRSTDWFFYLNGLQAEKGAASVKVHDGDHIWWDHHDWGETSEVPAVVGQFPAPFTQGEGGRRQPTRVECVEPESSACGVVADVLVKDLGLPAARGGLATSFVQETLRVVVGPWPRIQGDDTVGMLDDGPAKSGVYAKPSADGKQIALLDPTGKTVQTLGPGSGIVAAMKRPEGAAVWVITGTDAAGIEAAARAFNVGSLSGKFAVAVAPGGRPIGLPVVGSPSP